jgi:hypothetical protein
MAGGGRVGKRARGRSGALRQTGHHLKELSQTEFFPWRRRSQDGHDSLPGASVSRARVAARRHRALRRPQEQQGVDLQRSRRLRCTGRGAIWIWPSVRPGRAG